MKNNQTVTPATRQIINKVEKVWGHEEWIVNNEQYCGKKLVFKQGCHCSLHFHKIKHETFYLLHGSVILELEENDVHQQLLLSPGDSAEIAPMTKHKIIALTPSEVIEFSTHHDEADSYRIAPSGRLNEEEWLALQRYTLTNNNALQK